MKQGTKPTYPERKILTENGFDPKQWLVVRKLAHELEIRHRETNEVRKVSK